MTITGRKNAANMTQQHKHTEKQIEWKLKSVLQVIRYVYSCQCIYKLFQRSGTGNNWWQIYSNMKYNDEKHIPIGYSTTEVGWKVKIT